MNASRIVFASLLALAALGTAVAAETYEVDGGHSMVVFRIKHLGVSYTYGRFNDIKGSFVLDEEKPENTKVKVEIKAASVDTANAKRDDHLRGPDFFNVKQFPKISFESTKVTKTGDVDYEISGKLSLHGKSKEVTVRATRIGSGKDPWGGYRTGFELVFTVKRSEFGMNYMQGAEGIGDEVKLMVSIEGLRK